MTDQGFESSGLFGQGPFLTAGFICERFLRETDGVPSAIRIVNKVVRRSVGQPPPEQMEPFDQELVLYLAFRSGSARGPMPIEVKILEPTGREGDPFRETLEFVGDDNHSVEAVTRLSMRVESEGLYLFDVLLGGRLITRIPFTVEYRPRALDDAPR